MFAACHVRKCAAVVVAFLGGLGLGSGTTWAASSSGVVWQPNYAQAVEAAEQQGAMLFVFFYESDDDRLAQYFEWRVLDCEPVRQRLKKHVCVKLRCDATIRVGGKPYRLMDHAGFAGLHGCPGFAILDFTHKDADYYGCVVSVFPFTARRCYSARQMAVILDLPPGRPAERRALFLVRTRLCPGRNRCLLPVAPCLRPDLDQDLASSVPWLTNYAQAMNLAEQQRKMLLVYFCDGHPGTPCAKFKAETLSNPEVQRKLLHYVCVQLPLTAKTVSGGRQVALLEHDAFREMLGQPGIAIVDFAHTKADYYGLVVSTFPITQSLWYTPERMAKILDLPPGTLTQRTLIYAVRIHPESPASTDSKTYPDLLREAENHSQHQANLHLQGHHQWESRFHRIVGELPGGLTAKEVCAESWPGQHLVDAAIECVRCWRLSSGHWTAVRSPNNYYGYDMKLGTNGIWYATGIFGLR